jgi:hypothetical protein
VIIAVASTCAFFILIVMGTVIALEDDLCILLPPIILA